MLGCISRPPALCCGFSCGSTETAWRLRISQINISLWLAVTQGLETCCVRNWIVKVSVCLLAVSRKRELMIWKELRGLIWRLFSWMWPVRVALKKQWSGPRKRLAIRVRDVFLQNVMLTNCRASLDHTRKACKQNKMISSFFCLQFVLQDFGVSWTMLDAHYPWDLQSGWKSKISTAHWT